VHTFFTDDGEIDVDGRSGFRVVSNEKVEVLSLI
jgi:hypothetical protein